MSKNKIKVLQITGAMNRGGAEVMLMDIYRNISSDFHFDFLVNYKLNEGIRKGDFDNEIKEKGGTIKHIATQWDLGPVSYFREFKKIITEIGKPDVIHIHLNSRAGIIALCARIIGIKKIISHSHGDLVFKGSFIKNLPGIIELQIQKFLIDFFATDFWGCSQVAIKSLFSNRNIKNGKTLIINNATPVDDYLNVLETDTKKLKEVLKINKKKLVIGSVGRIVRRKNIGFVIDILNILNRRNIDFIFVNVGKTEDKIYMKEITDKIKSYQLEGRVMNLGLRDDIPSIMSIFDVFISPAHNEAFGMVAAEAQAAGLPCVLTTEFPKTIDMNLNLVSFVNNFDASNWADELIRVRGDKCYDKKLIKESFLKRGFDIKENVKNIENLYKTKNK